MTCLKQYLIVLTALLAVSRVIGDDHGARGPVPTMAEEQRAEAVVDQAYATDIARAKSPPDRIELAKRFFADAIATKDDTAGRFVLLSRAKKMAAELGEVRIVDEISNWVEENYEFDAWPWRVDGAQIAVKIARTPKDKTDLARLMISFSRRANQADHHVQAKQFAAAALLCANGAANKPLVQVCLTRIKEADSVFAEHEKVKPALTTLAERPTDPDANSAAGAFYCFVKEDWSRGVICLALGSDEELKKVAALELDDKTVPLELGDRWWDYSERQDAMVKASIRRRAAVHYRKASPTLTGLTKARVEARIAECASTQEFHDNQEDAGVKSDAIVGSPSSTPHKGGFGYPDVWMNVSYESTFKRVGKTWVETSNNTGKVMWTYIEVDRNERYIELLNAQRKQKMRILKTGIAEHDGRGRWEWVANGRWGHP